MMGFFGVAYLTVTLGSHVDEQDQTLQDQAYIQSTTHAQFVDPPVMDTNYEQRNKSD